MEDREDIYAEPYEATKGEFESEYYADCDSYSPSRCDMCGRRLKFNEATLSYDPCDCMDEYY